MKSSKKKHHISHRTKKKNTCAPISEDSFTCFNKSALITIINSWNSYYKDNKIVYKSCDSKKELWTKLNNKLQDKCDDDYCWTKQEFLKDNKDLKKNYFRPKMPKVWETNKREWLNTYDINKVMKQYETKYPNFHFIGAVPMDFDKKLSFGSCVIDELCNINIKRFIKKGKNKIGIILNLDNHDQEGSHWVSLFCDFEKNNIYYFDSYGYKETNEINNLVSRLQAQGATLNKDIKFHSNNVRNQYKDSECGVYSINFIERLLKGDTFDSILNNKVYDDEMYNNRKRYFMYK